MNKVTIKGSWGQMQETYLKILRHSDGEMTQVGLLLMVDL